MNKKYCYFNGDIIDWSEVRISPNDLGFVRGYGIFDAMRTVKGTPFFMEEHWDKFKKSAKDLNINLSISKSEFENIIQKLLEKNNFPESAIKTILTGGVSENGITMMNEPTLLITVEDLNKFLPTQEKREKGISAITFDFKRFLPELKTLNYIAAIKNQKKKEDAGAQEIIFIKKGNILEGATSNVFLIKDNILLTASEDIFKGTMRNLIIDLAKKNNLMLEERQIKKEELLEAQEVFATGTYKWILPVVKIDGKIVGDGTVGEATKKIMKLAEEFIENY